MSEFKILAINPGSTSTKIGLFQGDKEIFKATTQHKKEDIAQFKTVADQRPYRAKLIMEALKENGIELKDINAFAARGGAFAPLEGGVYNVNDLMIDEATTMFRGVHPANLACTIAVELAKENGQPCYIVNGPTVDEFADIARLTGLKGVYRRFRGHALNQKEVAYRYAEKIGKNYEDLNLIVAHIGGGISIGAHLKGKIVDSSDASHGEGPMAPTRTGTVAVIEALDLLKKGEDPAALRSKSSLTGGWIDHLDIDNGLDLAEEIKKGNKYAELVYQSTIYQISKWIGTMSIPLMGKVDAIVLTGGLSNDKRMVQEIAEYVKFLAPVEVMAGEFELEGLAAGVLRVLNNEETPKEYTATDKFAELEARYGI